MKENKYITFVNMQGNLDVYCSLSLDFDNSINKISLSQRGETCDTQALYGIIQEKDEFLAIYVDKLRKFDTYKAELKRECGKLGYKSYLLKDVKIFLILDYTDNKVMYQGNAFSNVNFNGNFKIAFPMPELEDFENVRNEEKLLVEIEDSVVIELKEDIYLDDNETLKSRIEETDNQGLITFEEEKVFIKETDVLEEKINNNSRNVEFKEFADEILKVTQSIEVESVDNEEVIVTDNLKESVIIGEIDGYVEENRERGNYISVEYKNIVDEFNRLSYSDIYDVEHCDMQKVDVYSDDKLSCNECGHEEPRDVENNENYDMYDDFEVFKYLYEKYIGEGSYENELDYSDEYAEDTKEFDYNLKQKNYDTYNEMQVLQNEKKEVENIKYKTENNEIQNFLNDMDSVYEKAKIINSSFRRFVDTGKTLNNNGNSAEFSKKNTDENSKKNNNSLVDMINYVKDEFNSIREIMSLSDEEFAKNNYMEMGIHRGENFTKEKNQDDKAVTIEDFTLNDSTSEYITDEHKEIMNTEYLTTEDRLKRRGNVEYSIIDDMIKSKESFCPFETVGHNIEWVKIKLNEVVSFFDEHWKMFWEPFVVDSYTRNNHLILGVENLDDVKNYFFGVPKEYSSENSNRAVELGFESFEVVNNYVGEIEEGSFGYFVKSLVLNDVKKEF